MNGDGRGAFRKQHRVRRPAEYERVYREGFRLSGSALLFAFRANGLGHARLGISASRRVGNAPQRSLLKRRLRELFRRDPSLRGHSVDIVVSVLKGVPRPAHGLLRRDLERVKTSIEKRWSR